MRLISVALVLLLTTAAAHADCDPPGLFRIVTANGSPGIPKVTYRAGNGLVRSEEMADTAGGVHQLSVIHWPDVWVVNLLAKDNNVVYAIRYLSYEHRDEVDPALFAKPEGIKFEEPLK